MDNIKKKKTILIVLLIIVVLVLIGVSLFAIMVSPVDKNGKEMEFVVNAGESYGTLADDLKSSGLIKNETFYKAYIKLIGPDNLEAGSYLLSPSMGLSKIIKTLQSGAVDLRKTVSVTFVEGKNMRYVISMITDKFNITEEEILSTLKDSTYLDSLISEYWFLTDAIKDENIYYSLEGYLYPDTYEFYENDDIKAIFKKMLDNMSAKLTPYKSEVESSGYTFHEMLTLASIIEQEAGSSTDRKGVAGVFYNRLKDSWTLGSDVTTYYAEKLELWSRDLYAKEINSCNSYNTRSSCMAGKLPIGPICNPSINSLVASIEPETHEYYYFVADINGQTYFNETSKGHTATVAKLKSEGKWYEY